MSLELRDEQQFPVHVEGVLQAERPTQLTHAQMPLQGFGVLWEGESLVSPLPQWNRVTQTVDKLKRERETCFTVGPVRAALQRHCCSRVSPERAAPAAGDAGISLGPLCSRVCLQTWQRTAPLALGAHLFTARQQTVTYTGRDTRQKVDAQRVFTQQAFFSTAPLSQSVY